MNRFEFEYKKRKLSKNIDENQERSGVTFRLPKQAPFQIQKLRQSLQQLMADRITKMFQGRSRIQRQVALKQKNINDAFRIKDLKKSLRDIQNLEQMKRFAAVEVEKFRDLDEENRQLLNQTINQAEQERIRLDIQQNNNEFQQAQRAFQETQDDLQRSVIEAVGILNESLRDVPELSRRINDSIRDQGQRGRLQEERHEDQINRIRDILEQSQIQTKENIDNFQRQAADLMTSILDLTQQGGQTQIQDVTKKFGNLEDIIENEALSEIQPQIQRVQINAADVFMKYYKTLQNSNFGKIDKDWYDKESDKYIFGSKRSAPSQPTVRGVTSLEDFLSQKPGKQEALLRTYQDPTEISKITEEISFLVDKSGPNFPVEELQKRTMKLLQAIEDQGVHVPQNRPLEDEVISKQSMLGQKTKVPLQTIEQGNPPAEIQIRGVCISILLIYSAFYLKLGLRLPLGNLQRVEGIERQDQQQGQEQIFQAQRQQAQRQLQLQPREFKPMDEEGEEEEKGQGKFQNRNGVSEKEMKSIIRGTFLKNIPYDIITLKDDNSDFDTKLSQEDLSGESFICFLIDLSWMDEDLQENSWHWICIYTTEHSVELYDPYGKYYPENVLRFAEEIADNGFVQRKIKGSTVTQQLDDSDSCAYFVIWFLMQRVQDIPFDKATYFKSIKYREKQMDKLRKNFDNIGVKQTSDGIEQQLQNI